MPIHCFPACTKSVSRTTVGHSIRAACAALAAFCFLAVRAWPSDTTQCTVPAGALASPTNQGPNAGFYSNFVANGNLATYGIPIGASNGQNLAGDLNSTFSPIYYSLANLQAWMANSPGTHCPVELVIAGIFPDVRYFSVSDNDMHYTATQHLADADMDPAIVGSSQNPFVPGVPNSRTQPYIVPVSLGYVPTVPSGTAGCAINAYEGENLLDATQRHLSNDWNTNVQGPTVAGGQLTAHVVDLPGHSAPTASDPNGQNMAGSVVIRSYLPPYSCQGNLGSSLSCAPETGAVPRPFFFIRDAQSGCPYMPGYLKAPTWTPAAGATQQPMVYAPAPGAPYPNCAQNPPPVGCDAVASIVDLSGNPSLPAPNWLDTIQKQQHTNDANLTAQSCYANGDPAQNSPPSIGPSLYNRVPWTRGPQWNGTPGPDDSYIGGAISKSDMAGMIQGSPAPSCAQTGNGCVMRFRFQLPAMPCTPVGSATCDSLTGNEQLRYLSLTFWQQQHCASQSEPRLAGPESIDANNATCAVSLVSMADTAFTTTNGYVTLIVNAGPSGLPGWLAELPNGTGVKQGMSPGANGIFEYAAWTTPAGYNVLDLEQFNGSNGTAVFDPADYPLLLTVRNTLPNMSSSNPFKCSGAAVPFATAVYTNVDGNGATLMGPYVPLVDYVDPNSLPQTPPPLTTLPLPSATYCGVLPANALPGQNAPSPNQPLDWPTQSWPTSPGPTWPPLNCSPGSAGSPTIDFVATQFPTPVDTSSVAQNCGATPNNCSQIVVQSPQTTELAAGTPWQPPLPVTIVGSGFGFLPNLPQAMASCASPAQCPNLLEISNDDASGAHLSTWDTSNGATCQVYIANWTDTSISLVANLQVGLQDDYELAYQSGVYLTPLSDISPASFPAVPPVSAIGCPVAYKDHLYFTVTNPQSGATVKQPFQATVLSKNTPPK